jgi:hypothetical protein
VIVSCLRVPPRKYWEAVLVVFFDKSFHNFPLPNYECFSANNGMLFVEEVDIFLLRDVKQTTNILSSFGIVCIYDSSFAGLFNKNMSFLRTPKCVPDHLKRYLFDIFCPVLPQVSDHLGRYSVSLLVSKPGFFLYLRFKVLRKLNTQPTSFF